MFQELDIQNVITREEISYSSIRDIVGQRKNRFDSVGMSHLTSTPDFWDGVSSLISVRNRENDLIGALNFNMKTSPKNSSSYFYNQIVADHDSFREELLSFTDKPIFEIFRLFSVDGKGNLLKYTAEVFSLVQKLIFHRIGPRVPSADLLIAPLNSQVQDAYLLFAEHVSLDVTPLKTKVDIPGHSGLDLLLLSSKR
ncbi:hypothetical protein [Yoonia sp. R2-816]|uniref:hypothetical protein n=1 Tax=Yoonia sp. R2-816 TaxID=3342638 RepID=UPI00372C2C3D